MLLAPKIWISGVSFGITLFNVYNKPNAVNSGGHGVEFSFLKLSDKSIYIFVINEPDGLTNCFNTIPKYWSSNRILSKCLM